MVLDITTTPMPKDPRRRVPTLVGLICRVNAGCPQSEPIAGVTRAGVMQYVMHPPVVVVGSYSVCKAADLCRFVNSS